MKIGDLLSKSIGFREFLVKLHAEDASLRKEHEGPSFSDISNARLCPQVDVVILGWIVGKERVQGGTLTTLRVLRVLRVRPRRRVMGHSAWSREWGVLRERKNNKLKYTS